MLREEFVEILSFFNLEASEKKERFAEMLAKSLEFSEKMRDKLVNGTTEEKNEVEEILAEMKEHISLETNKICDAVGVSAEELPAYLSNPSNFSSDEWTTVRDTLQEAEMAGVPIARPSPAKKVKKIKSTKMNWIQS
jgi:hypothetical protein